MIRLPRLYAIADATFGDPVTLAQALFDGGAELVQIRNKNAGAGEFLSQTERILRFAPRMAAVIVNDRADIARISGAAGVHLGQTDLPVIEARSVLAAAQIIGMSTHNLEQALKADQSPVDYLAVGPIFPTSTKTNPDPVVGLENLAAICRAVQKPVVAIGGIKLQEASAVLSAGAASIAVISDILKARDITERTRAWVQAVMR